jgi:hypothetical protein
MGICPWILLSQAPVLMSALSCAIADFSQGKFNSRS